MLARDVSWPDRACRSKSAPLKPAVDHRGVEAVLLGRRPTFGVQDVRYALRRRPVGSESGNPGELFVEVLQLLEAPHGSAARLIGYHAEIGRARGRERVSMDV